MLIQGMSKWKLSRLQIFFRKYNVSVLILVVVVLLCSLFRLYVCKKNRWLLEPFAVCCWRRASVILNTFDAESQTVFFVVFCASTAAFSLSTFIWRMLNRFNMVVLCRVWMPRSWKGNVTGSQKEIWTIDDSRSRDKRYCTFGKRQDGDVGTPLWEHSAREAAVLISNLCLSVYRIWGFLKDDFLMLSCHCLSQNSLKPMIIFFLKWIIVCDCCRAFFRHFQIIQWKSTKQFLYFVH